MKKYNKLQDITGVNYPDGNWTTSVKRNKKPGIQSVLFFIVVLSLINFNVQTVFALTSGPNYPGTGTNVTGVGTVSWTNLTNIYSNNNQYANVTCSQNVISNYLQATNFGFNIPTNATINGIQVTIGRYSSGTLTPRIRDYRVMLVHDGSITGTNLAATTTDWPTTENTATYGSTSQLWGLSWTPAQINASNFGVALSVTNSNSSSRTAYVDYFTITVTYTVPAPTVTGFSPGNGCQGAPGIVISGTNFTGATSVSFNGTSASFNVDNSMQITATVPLTATSGTISVTTPGGTGSSSSTFTVNPLPSAAGTITGTASVCQNETGVSYSVSSITNATSYIWSYSGTGATINGSSNSVTIDFASNATSGNLTVKGHNDCGDGTASVNYSITVNLTPSATGATICQGGSGSLTSMTTCPTLSNQTSGPDDAGSGASVDGPGTIAWTNPGYITADDLNYATAVLTTGTTSEYLQGSNYGFSIPVNATINGIQVSIMRQSSSNSGSNSINDVELYLLKSGVITGTNHAVTTDWATSMTSADYGSTSDLWGATWLPSDINSTSFGVSLSVYNQSTFSSRTASVDYIKVTVTYTIDGILYWYTSSSGGSPIGSGSPFNPVASLPGGNTNTPGTYIFYAECSSSAGCRAAADFVIEPYPTANAGSALSPICQGGTSTALGGSVGGSATGGTWSDGGIGGTFNPDATTLNATWTPPALYSGTATLTLTTSGGVCTAASASKSQVVNPTTVSGTAAAAVNALCTSNSGTTISLTGSTGAIQWQKFNGTGWDNVGTGGVSYNTGTLGSTAYYRASVTSGVCPSEASNVTGVYLNPTYIWNGNTDNDWTTLSNWKFDGYDESPNVSPPSCSDVIIPNIGSDDYPTLTLASSATINDLTMEDGASLMGNNFLTVSGTATMKKIINDTWDWHLLSSPVPSQLIWDQFAPAPSGSGYADWKWLISTINWDFYYFNPKVTNVYPHVPWVNLRKASIDDVYFPYNDGPVDATTPNGTGADAGFGQAQPSFTPGRGYLVAYNTSYADEHDFTDSGSDPFNDGNYTVTLSTTGSNFHLVGNPYPSSIDWGSSNWGTNRAGLKVSGSGFDYWIWDDSGSGNYRTGNSGGTYGTGISRYIAPMQGFFVKADSLVTGGMFTMTNSVRAHSTQSWVKSDEIQNNILRLKLSTDQNTYWDEMIVDFNSSYSGDEGSPKLASWYTSAPEIWSLKNGNKYTFDRYKEISSALEVNVNVKCGVSGPYTISATNIDEFDLSNIVYLEDLKTGNKVNLKEVGSYSFTGGPNDDKARFRVTFAEITGTNDAALQKPVYIYSFEKDVFVNAGSLTTGSCDVYIYDAIGRLVYNGRYNPVAGNHKFTTLQTPGAYVVKVISHSGTTTAKVIIP